MDNASNIFNYSVGGIALGTTGISTVVWIKSCLPDNRMKELDGVLLTTRQEYERSDLEGLLPQEFKVTVATKLASLERSRDELKEHAYRAITLLDQFIAFMQGLSSQIMYLSNRVKVLRAQVVTKSEESRRLRDSQNTIPRDVQSFHSDAPLTDNASHPRDTMHEVNRAAVPCDEDRPLARYDSTVGPLISAVQSGCQPTVTDGPGTPQPLQLTGSIWTRLWNWRSPSLHPLNDLESGTGSPSASI